MGCRGRDGLQKEKKVELSEGWRWMNLPLKLVRLLRWPRPPIAMRSLLNPPPLRPKPPPPLPPPFPLKPEVERRHSDDELRKISMYLGKRLKCKLERAHMAGAYFRDKLRAKDSRNGGKFLSNQGSKGKLKWGPNHEAFWVYSRGTCPKGEVREGVGNFEISFVLSNQQERIDWNKIEKKAIEKCVNIPSWWSLAYAQFFLDPSS